MDLFLLIYYIVYNKHIKKRGFSADMILNLEFLRIILSSIM